MWTPSVPRWSALMLVTTETSLAARPIPRSRMPPRAVSVTATCTRGSSSTRAAPPGPDQSPVSTISPSMTMPSVDDQPGTRPPAFTRCEISRVVVVLPFVPVTAITGMVGRIGRITGPTGTLRRRCRAAAMAVFGSTPRSVMAPKAAATASPNASARSRCLNGNATTTVPSSPGPADGRHPAPDPRRDPADQGRGEIGDRLDTDLGAGHPHRGCGRRDHLLPAEHHARRRRRAPQWRPASASPQVGRSTGWARSGPAAPRERSRSYCPPPSWR